MQLLVVKDMSEERVAELLKQKAEFRCALTLEPGSIAYVPPGWHVWRQNGGSGGNADCKDIVCFEFHGLPAGLAATDFENMQQYTRFMQHSKHKQRDLIHEMNFAQAVLNHRHELSALPLLRSKSSADVGATGVEQAGLAAGQLSPVTPGASMENAHDDRPATEEAAEGASAAATEQDVVTGGTVTPTQGGPRLGRQVTSGGEEDDQDQAAWALGGGVATAVATATAPAAPAEERALMPTGQGLDHLRATLALVRDGREAAEAAEAEAEAEAESAAAAEAKEAVEAAAKEAASAAAAALGATEVAVAKEAASTAAQAKEAAAAAGATEAAAASAAAAAAAAEAVAKETAVAAQTAAGAVLEPAAKKARVGTSDVESASGGSEVEPGAGSSKDGNRLTTMPLMPPPLPPPARPPPASLPSEMADKSAAKAGNGPAAAPVLQKAAAAVKKASGKAKAAEAKKAAAKKAQPSKRGQAAVAVPHPLPKANAESLSSPPAKKAKSGDGPGQDVPADPKSSPAEPASPLPKMPGLVQPGLATFFASSHRQ